LLGMTTMMLVGSDKRFFVWRKEKTQIPPTVESP
jgi:hypothetical protein